MCFFQLGIRSGDGPLLFRMQSAYSLRTPWRAPGRISSPYCTLPDFDDNSGVVRQILEGKSARLAAVVSHYVRPTSTGAREGHFFLRHTPCHIGPCRAFTPLLAAFYEESKAHEVEVVFVSADHDDADFFEYFSGMPWHAIPFEDDSTRDGLNVAHGVAGIPTLIVIDNATGTVLTKDGRAKATAAKKLDGVAWA